MTWQRCTGRGGSSCTNVNGAIVIDANCRWLHSVGGYTNCFDGNEWNTTACPNNAACTRNCAIEGSDYRGTYGITISGNALTPKVIDSGGSGIFDVTKATTAAATHLSQQRQGHMLPKDGIKRSQQAGGQLFLRQAFEAGVEVPQHAASTMGNFNV
jgi:hypothetical protein